MSNKRASKNLIIWYNAYKGARCNGRKSKILDRIG